MIRVLDVHTLVRTGVRLILANQTDSDVVGEAASGEEGLPLTRILRPDATLCDVQVPGVSVLEITERVSRPNARAWSSS